MVPSGRAGSRRVRPLMPQACQAGSPLMSHHLANLAEQTELLWACGGNEHSWYWPDPNSAPSVSISAWNTTNLFLLGDSTEEPVLRMPWYQSDGFDTICADVVVAKKGKGGLALDLYLRVNELLTTEDWADITSVAVRCNFNSAPMPSLWTDDSGAWRLARVRLSCGPLTLGASKTCNMRLLAGAVAENDAVWSAATTFDTEVRLYSLKAWDAPIDRSGLDL